MVEVRYPRRLWIQVYVTVFVCAAIWLNPSRDVHKERLRATADVNCPVKKSLLEDDTAAAGLEYQNYILFSTTEVAGERTTLGFMGRVFTSSEREWGTGGWSESPSERGRIQGRWLPLAFCSSSHGIMERRCTCSCFQYRITAELTNTTAPSMSHRSNPLQSDRFHRRFNPQGRVCRCRPAADS